MPRMATMEAEGDHDGLILIYRKATQLVAVLAGSAAVTLAFFAEPLLWAWTGDRDVAQSAAPVLTLYALGNGILAVSAFPYYLQYAKGDLRLHLIGNAIFVGLLVPLIVWSTSRYGAIGAGYVWLGINLLTFIVWLPFVHHRFAPGLNLSWYIQDILRFMVVASAVAWIASAVLDERGGRLAQLVQIIATGTIVVFCAALNSQDIRQRFMRLYAGLRFPRDSRHRDKV